MLRALGWEEGVSFLPWEAREAGVESLLRNTVVLGGGYRQCRRIRRRKPAAPIRASVT